jgi:hypothetical protein
MKKSNHMKKIITKTFTMSLFVLLCVFTNGQSIESNSNNNRFVWDASNYKKVNLDSMLFIVVANKKKLIIPENGNFLDSLEFEKTMSNFIPEKIESMEVLKGKNATERYGDLRQSMVIQINLKKGSLKKLPDEIRKKFKRA